MSSTIPPAPTPLRLLLVDDHPVLRAGLKAMLSAEPDLTVIAEADTGLAAVDLALRLEPDLSLKDVTLPGLNGAEATRKIKVERSEALVLALSVHEEWHMRCREGARCDARMRECARGRLRNESGHRVRHADERRPKASVR